MHDLHPPAFLQSLIRRLAVSAVRLVSPWVGSRERSLFLRRRLVLLRARTPGDDAPVAARCRRPSHPCPTRTVEASPNASSRLLHLRLSNYSGPGTAKFERFIIKFKEVKKNVQEVMRINYLNHGVFVIFVEIFLLSEWGNNLSSPVDFCTITSFRRPMQVLFIMRPSSLGGGRILRRTLSVRLSVRPVIVAIGNVFSSTA